MSKSNPLESLGGLVQRKGAAQRPVEMPQRGELATPVAQAEVKETLKALTLRLPISHWRHLRDHAHKAEISHQQLLEEAVRLYFEAKGNPLP
jgi:hypothetical protein